MLVFAILVAALVGCSQPPSVFGANDIKIQIDGQDLISSGTDPDQYYVPSLTTLRPVSVVVYATAAYQINVNGQAVQAGQSLNLTLMQLTQSSHIEIDVVRKDSFVQHFQIQTLPPDFPQYTVIANNPTPGRILLTPNDTATNSFYLLMLDAYGNPLYYKKLNGQGMNFALYHTSDGKIRYSYLEADASPFQIGYTGGTTYVMDENLRVIDTVRLLPYNNHPSYPAEGHDFLVLEDGHYLVMGYVPQQVSNVPTNLTGGKPTSNVVAAIIQEQKNGRVVFEWNSTQYPELYQDSTDGNDFANANSKFADYAHLNSITIDPNDNNLVVSFRHLDQVIKLNRTTGDIIWKLGGLSDQFGLSPTQKFSHQHFVRFLPDESLTIFDNGNATGKTLLLTLGLDQVAKHLTQYGSYEVGQRFSFAAGSVQHLSNGRLFIGWGLRGTNDSDATEIDPQTNVISFQLFFNGTSYYSYRALKYEGF